AKLDLTDSKFIVTEPASQSVVRDEILAQRITSSLLNSSRAIGYAQAGDIGLATFGGMDVSGDDLLMRMTLKGDTNLDGAVNFPDLLKVAHNYGLTGFWSGGDFTFDGNVNFNDLLPIAQNYGSSMLVDGSFTSDEWMNGSFESDWALALQSVPEPGVLSLLMLGTVTLRRRR
ncbi:MAG TPA: PEP-CTERM sorting domain-containing protein, partial [Tepidisphaeraceae bacterium]|nr:PEP-CTERM sorting domain-containing protein [Tepidisphaeraceae bacterium]